MSLWKWLKDHISQLVVGTLVGVAVLGIGLLVPLIDVFGLIFALVVLWAAIATFYLVAQKKDGRKGLRTYDIIVNDMHWRVEMVRQSDSGEPWPDVVGGPECVKDYSGMVLKDRVGGDFGEPITQIWTCLECGREGKTYHGISGIREAVQALARGRWNRNEASDPRF